MIKCNMGYARESVLKRLTEKFRGKKKLFFIFVEKCVPEYLVRGVVSLYKGCRTAVSVDEELSSSFSVKFSVHQGSALSPLRFIMVIGVLTENVKDVSLMELLYSDDPVLCKESLNEIMDKYGR